MRGCRPSISCGLGEGPKKPAAGGGWTARLCQYEAELQGLAAAQRENMRRDMACGDEVIVQAFLGRSVGALAFPADSRVGRSAMELQCSVIRFFTAVDSFFDTYERSAYRGLTSGTGQTGDPRRVTRAQVWSCCSPVSALGVPIMLLSLVEPGAAEGARRVTAGELADLCAIHRGRRALGMVDDDGAIVRHWTMGRLGFPQAEDTPPQDVAIASLVCHELRVHALMDVVFDRIMERGITAPLRAPAERLCSPPYEMVYRDMFDHHVTVRRALLSLGHAYRDSTYSRSQ